MITLALFNNKGGVGKTTLAYHLAHMLHRLGNRVLAVDLDPQANLTSVFLEDGVLEVLWQDPSYPVPVGQVINFDLPERSGTVAAAVRPIMEGLGDIDPSPPVQVDSALWLVPGDLALSAFEDRLSTAWPLCFTGDAAALRTTTAFHRIIHAAAEEVQPDIVVMDVGPNLGAINRAALLAADAVVVPLAADLFSLRGLRNLGPTLRTWRSTWQDLVLPKIPAGIHAPAGDMTPIGYVIMQPVVRLDRPAQAYQRWLQRIPEVYATAVLGLDRPVRVGRSYEIATLRNYQSLMPLAHDARKPMFDLRAGDGALGATQTYVQRCYQDFRQLSLAVLDRLTTEHITGAPAAS
jgi:cellulose biosynthesis protein BcsQ